MDQLCLCSFFPSALPDGSAAAAQQYPGKDIKSVSLMHGQMLFRVQDKKDAAPVRARMGMGGEQLAYDVQSGTLSNARGGVKSQAVSSFMHTMHRLHMYFGLGRSGMIFLGFIYEELKSAIEQYIKYYNEERIKEKLCWKSPVQYRLSLCSA